MCKYCKEISEIAEGKCHHPNGADDMVKEKQIVTGKDEATMIRCNLYSGKDPN
jgi:hypothetical protein